MDQTDLFKLSALFHNATAIALWLFWLLVIVFVATRKKWRVWVRLSLIGAIIAQQIIFVVIPMYRHYQAKAVAAEKEKRGIAEYQAWKAKAQAMFDERCKKAGYFVYKKVPKQDSVYIMTPSFEEPTSKQIQDQYWQGDPYTYRKYDLGSYGIQFGGYLYPSLSCETKVSQDSSGNRIFTPVYQWHEANFKYIEAPAPNEKSDLAVSYKRRSELERDGLFSHDRNQIMRYEAEATERQQSASGGGYCTKSYPAYQYKAMPVSQVSSTYGVRTEDISTKEERDNWIAGSRLQIIELKTGDVVAERIGYLWNYAPEQTMHSSRGWDYTLECPEHRDNSFILYVLAQKDYYISRYITYRLQNGETQ